MVLQELVLCMCVCHAGVTGADGIVCGVAEVCVVLCICVCHGVAGAGVVHVVSDSSLLHFVFAMILQKLVVLCVVLQELCVCLTWCGVPVAGALGLGGVWFAATGQVPLPCCSAGESIVLPEGQVEGDSVWLLAGGD